jgi:NAD(P)-dependent dehydrogenase (short-subunit alcohol dehydrogenase family)
MSPELTPAPNPGPRKVALITGGAKRIGREISLTLARAGMDIAITYRESENLALETAREIEAAGVRCLALKMDVRSEEDIRRTVAAVAEAFGRIDVLVNNAGVIEKAVLQEITAPQWDRMFEINTRGPFLTSREALPYLKAAQGRIINLGSLGGMEPWAAQAHYCSSKAALHMLTQTMAKAFAPEVSVNCVAPGYIEMHRLGDGPERPIAPIFASRTPMGRNGTAEETAAAVLFFATGPHFITGQIMAVDGGLGL